MSQSLAELQRAHGRFALIPRGRNSGGLRFATRFLFAQDPIGRFGEMPGYGADRLRMALAPRHALVETTNVAVRRAAARLADRVRGFDEGPFQVVVHVGAEPTVAGFPATRANARRGAGIP